MCAFTRKDLWAGDICDYAAILWVLGRSLLSEQIINILNLYLSYEHYNHIMCIDISPPTDGGGSMSHMLVIWSL